MLHNSAESRDGALQGSAVYIVMSHHANGLRVSGGAKDSMFAKLGADFRSGAPGATYIGVDDVCLHPGQIHLHTGDACEALGQKSRIGMVFMQTLWHFFQRH